MAATASARALPVTGLVKGNLKPLPVDAESAPMGNAVRLALVCDDDPMLAAVASVLLKDEGFDVTTVGTAAELAAVLAASTPHIVILDQELPDAAGEELVDGIRAAAPACRIIMFSGHEQTSDLDAAVFARVSKRGTDGLAAAIHRAAAA